MRFTSAVVEPGWHGSRPTDRVLPGGPAVLTVAYRLATAREADRVLVMAAGRVVEEGAPAALLATASRFADLAALEAAG